MRTEKDKISTMTVLQTHIKVLQCDLSAIMQGLKEQTLSKGRYE